MSEQLHNRGPWDRGRYQVAYFFGLDLSDTAEPERQVEFDYPSFMARELTRGLLAYGGAELA